MDNSTPSVNDDTERQLREYRELMRQRHPGGASGNVATPPSNTPQPAPSAPPLSPAQRGPLYPSLQEYEDAELARKLQQQEQEYAHAPAPPPEDEELARRLQESDDEDFNRTSSSVDSDEEFARRLQESDDEDFNENQSLNDPDELLARQLAAEEGLDPSNMPSFTQQRQPRPASPPSPDPALRQEQEHEDEEYARQLQEQEDSEEEDDLPTRRMQGIGFYPPPLGSHPPMFRFGYPSARAEVDADPRSSLGALSTLFRTMAPQGDPLFEYMTQMINNTPNRRHVPPIIHDEDEEVGYHPVLMPQRRIQFPPGLFGYEGAEELPPDMQDMMRGNREATYEDMLRLSEMVQPVNRGATQQVRLEVHTLNDNSILMAMV
eukprot:TRINITY_DN4890_c0_g1_i1.p1 TRINITY_DN4890_c0_g1~~TRINITY_DN4890_c0_g1_i1.p1  ORF type:complete len:377 (+),score=76.32 TRINITY_DN4890_c0_g1_i1:41-1171(+)